jgi:hypothetical protein
MTKNPILDELHTVREALLAEADGDLDQLVAGIREREAKSGHKVVSVPVGHPQRTIGPGEANHSGSSPIARKR